MPSTHDTGKCRLFHCAKCGYGVNDIFLDNEHDHLRDKGPLFNFCPWCGRTVHTEEKTTP